MPPEQQVYVIDDDEAARESLALLMTSSGFAVASYASPLKFLEDLALLRPGCVVTDIRMPEMDGLELLRRVNRVFPKLPVIVVTGHGDVPRAVEAIRTGAVDFVEKPYDGDALVRAVTDALARQREETAEWEERAAIIARLETLSARERQVLDGLVAGHPNKIIAYDLGISIRTIEIYRANLMAKMNASSLSDLVRMALIGGIAKPRHSSVA